MQDWFPSLIFSACAGGASRRAPASPPAGAAAAGTPAASALRPRLPRRKPPPDPGSTTAVPPQAPAPTPAPAPSHGETARLPAPRARPAAQELGLGTSGIELQAFSLTPDLEDSDAELARSDAQADLLLQPGQGDALQKAAMAAATVGIAEERTSARFGASAAADSCPAGDEIIVLSDSDAEAPAVEDAGGEGDTPPACRQSGSSEASVPQQGPPASRMCELQPAAAPDAVNHGGAGSGVPRCPAVLATDHAGPPQTDAGACHAEEAGNDGRQPACAASAGSELVLDAEVVPRHASGAGLSSVYVIGCLRYWQSATPCLKSPFQALSSNTWLAKFRGLS